MVVGVLGLFFVSWLGCVVYCLRFCTCTLWCGVFSLLWCIVCVATICHDSLLSRCVGGIVVC